MSQITQYVPPMGKGQRVIATAASELVPEGTLGTITWTHPFPDMPYRVQWDGHEVKPGEFYMGMSDIGWLARPHELEALDVEEVPADAQ